MCVQIICIFLSCQKKLLQNSAEETNLQKKKQESLRTRTDEYVEQPQSNRKFYPSTNLLETGFIHEPTMIIVIKTVFMVRIAGT